MLDNEFVLEALVRKIVFSTPVRYLGMVSSVESWPRPLTWFELTRNKLR